MPCSQREGDGKKAKDLLCASLLAMLAKVLTVISEWRSFPCMTNVLADSNSQGYESRIEFAWAGCTCFTIASKHQKDIVIGLIFCNACLRYSH